MKMVEDAAWLRHELAGWRGERIAFVPTMGCLHDGHISLIRKAKKLADVVVVSIYVNPLQFGPQEDLERYPRPFAEDARRCQAEGVDVLFHPHSLYDASGPLVTLHGRTLGDCLCGAHRPGHFDGVLTVVNVLFNIVQPDVAVFGEKDWQQLTLIRRMVHDLHMPVEVVAAPIVREADGLAMSSRNRYLSPSLREQAGALVRTLRYMQDMYRQGQNDATILLESGHRYLREHGLDAEYLDIREESSLRSLTRIGHENARVFIAARVGDTRLIDNLLLTEP